MMRTCPKCGDYYADELLAFCLSDGTPLLNVKPLGESWREGARIIEEKEKALRRKRRRLQWRRVLLSVMTMLVVAMIVCVLAVNALIYLRPTSDEEPPPTPATLAPTIPIDPIKVKLRTPTRPTPQTPKPKPTPKPTPKCSAADQGRERKSIMGKYFAEWERRFAADRQKIIAANTPAGARDAEARLGPIKYAVTFNETCTTAFVTARYEWLVTAKVNNVNNQLTAEPRSYEKRLGQQPKLRCVKSVGAWVCR